MLENWSYVDMLYLIAVPILLHFTLSRFYFSKATKNGKKVRFSGKDQVVEHISEEEKSQSDEEVKQEEKKATPEKKKREFPPLKPAEDYPFEATELAKFDGTNPELPIYVAIKGVVFDVTWNRTAYAPGSGYHVFAGKDASKALGMSSLKSEDCIADYSGLTDKQRETLDGWYQFFMKRYSIVGRVSQN